MGTNFYLHRQTKPACDCCGRGAEVDVLHIGKSSAGWMFALHVIYDRGLLDLPDWERLWAEPGVAIKDEYGDALTPAEMRARITERHADLMRHPRDHRCVKHGAGTWDCLEGEFS